MLLQGMHRRYFRDWVTCQRAKRSRDPACIGCDTTCNYQQSCAAAAPDPWLRWVFLGAGVSYEDLTTAHNLVLQWEASQLRGRPSAGPGM